MVPRCDDPCPKDATDAERIAARPASKKSPGSKVQFLYMQSWHELRVEPISYGYDYGDGYEKDRGMWNERYLDLVEDEILPMCQRAKAKYLFSDGARQHCRPPMSSADSSDELVQLLEPHGVVAVPYPPRAPDLSYW